MGRKKKTKLVACSFSHLPSKDTKDEMQFKSPILPANLDWLFLTTTQNVLHRYPVVLLVY